MAVERIPIAPEVMKWARKTAGYADIEVAAKKLVVPIEQVEGWESGAVEPTIAQLRKAAKLYKRPLAVLLLPNPPKDFSVPHNYRKLKGEEANLWPPTLHAEYKRALSQREVIIELEEVSPDSVSKTSNKIKVSNSMPATDLGKHFRSILEIDKWPNEVKTNPNKALNAAIDAAEEMGILIIQTKGVSYKEMRGMSISKWPHPVVILNGSDWPRPRLFSLLHELAHIARNSSAICDLHEVKPQLRDEDDSLEHYCNQVAANILMPEELIEQNAALSKISTWTVELLREYSRNYSASSEAFLLRLIDLGKANWDGYKRIKPQLDKLYEEERAKFKAKQKDKASGPTFYIVKARDLGHGYIHSIMAAFDMRAISSYDAADYLDVKYNQIPKLQEALRQ
jgi:Zn-dependent peptidase ImmA (M78 family)